MALAVRLWLDKKKHVRLCAPTGRAAQRMAELLATIAPELASDLDPPSTIHRLLEYMPSSDGRAASAAGGGEQAADAIAGGSLLDGGSEPVDDFLERFQRNSDHPLELDALVVDEASMLDLPLAAALLAALPPRAQLLLVGDPDQLPPVGPGSPLLDALRSGVITPSTLTDLFRTGAGSLIARATQAVHSGAFPPLAPVSLGDPSAAGASTTTAGSVAQAMLARARPRPPIWDPHAGGFSARASAAVPFAQAMAAGWDALWVRMEDHPAPPPAGQAGGALDETMRIMTRLVTESLPAAGFKPSRDLQVLIPMRKGPTGSAALCALLAPLLNPRAGSSGGPPLATLRVGGATYAVGDRVLQGVNDYEKEVFNGDLVRVAASSGGGARPVTPPVRCAQGTVTRVEPEARALTVRFGSRDELRYAGADADALSPAWAVTVHKAQGCEFPVVILVLDPGQSARPRAPRAHARRAHARPRAQRTGRCCTETCCTLPCHARPSCSLSLPQPAL
jgi:exodeoxyribonuclease V alpha subunit